MPAELTQTHPWIAVAAHFSIPNDGSKLALTQGGPSLCQIFDK